MEYPVLMDVWFRGDGWYRTRPGIPISVQHFEKGTGASSLWQRCRISAARNLLARLGGLRLILSISVFLEIFPPML